MSNRRLSVILSHQSGSKYGVQRQETSDEFSSVWNPPAREVKLNNGETITFRNVYEADLPQLSSLLERRDFVDADVSAAIKCPGFVGAVAENKDGLIVSCCLGMIHTAHVSSGGHVHVHRAYRRNDLPFAMFQYMSEILSSSTTENESYLYGIKENILFYEHIGLSIDDPPQTFITVVGTFHSGYYVSNTCDITVQRLRPEHLGELCKYDELVHKIKRNHFIKALCFHESSRTFVAFRGNSICGYGVLRQRDSLYKVAPLFADYPSVAEMLYRKMDEEIPRGCTIVMTVPSDNRFMMKFIEVHDFTIVKTWLRLREVMNWYRYNVSIGYEKVFALTNMSVSLC